MPKCYMTPEGYRKIVEEWTDLKEVQRPEMQRQVQAAAAEGDRSENAAYTFGKMRLREIDRRLRYLDRLIANAAVVEKIVDDGTVRFGATVKLRRLADGRESEYTIVGKSEADVVNGKISNESPLAAELIGRRAGETISLPTPRGPQKLEILSIAYGAVGTEEKR